MTIVRNCELSINMIRESVLLHAWVEVYFDYITIIFLKGKLFDGTAERLVNLEIDCSRKWTHVFNHKFFRNCHRGYAFFPQVFEI